MLFRSDNDKKMLFPMIKDLSTEYGSEEVLLEEAVPENDTLEEKLRDIKNLIIIHLSGEYDENLCYAVLVSICNLEKDINQHNRIRNRILFPLVNALNKKK